MKRTLLLSLGLGAALAASAAVPNYLQQVRSNSNLPKANAERISLAEMPVSNECFKLKDFKNLKGVSKLATRATAAAASQNPLYLQYNMFQEGLGSDFSGFSMPVFVCPPFTEVAYLNATEQNTATWTYGVGDQSKAGGETYTSDDKHLIVNYPATYSSAPKLKVADGSEWQPYGEYQGSNVAAVVNSLGFPECSLSAQTFGYNWAPKASDGYLFGSDCNAGVNGYGVFFDTPAAPYYVYSATMLFTGLTLKNNAELTLNVYSVDDQGKIGDKIAVGKASADDVTKANDVLSSVEFKFYEEDDLGGLTQIVMYPETGVFYEFGDFQGNSDIYFDSVVFNVPYIDQDWTIPYTYPIEAGYLIANGNLVPFSEALKGLEVYASPILWVNGVLGGIELAMTDNHFADNGGSVEFAVNTNAEYLQGYAESPVDFFGIENDLPDWLSVSLSYDEKDGTTFEITADPLPAGVTGRRADLSFTTSIGGRAVFIATQGDASVSNVEASASKVAVVDGNFVVESDNATAVEVYNLAGQKVAQASFAGKATVPAADLAKGVYVVKFNDNTVVKVAK